MKILGIDIATNLTGWAIYDDENNSAQTGVVDASAIDNIEDKLSYIYDYLFRLVYSLKPTEIAVEDQHYSRNISVLKSLSQARGVVMLLASQCGLPLSVIVPSTAKKAITGNGKASKDEVRDTVKKEFNIDNISFDEADAIAIAYAAYLQRNGDDNARIQQK